MKLTGLLLTTMVFGAGVAQAQSSTNSQSSKSNAVLVASSADPEENADQTSVVVADNQPSTQKNFGITWYFIGGQTLNNDSEQLSNFDIFDSYISFNYKINRNFKISARPAFGYALQGTTNVGKETNDRARIRDFSFVTAFSNVFEDSLPVDWNYKFAPRLYLPTSDGSKDEGMIARLRLEQFLTYKLSRYSELSFYAKPSYYFQRSTTYVNSSGKIRTTKAADSEHGIELDYSLSKMFSIVPALNFIESWSNASGANDQATYRSSVLDYRLGLEVRATRDISFTLGLQREQDMLAKKDPEMSYSLLTGGTLF